MNVREEIIEHHFNRRYHGFIRYQILALHAILWRN